MEYDNPKYNQVIEHLPCGKIRIHKIIEVHTMTMADPLTTVEVSGYEDVEGIYEWEAV